MSLTYRMCDNFKFKQNSVPEILGLKKSFRIAEVSCGPTILASQPQTFVFKSNFSTKNKSGDSVKKRGPSYTVDGNVNWYSHCGKQYGGSFKS